MGSLVFFKWHRIFVVLIKFFSLFNILFYFSYFFNTLTLSSWNDFKLIKVNSTSSLQDKSEDVTDEAPGGQKKFF